MNTPHRDKWTAFLLSLAVPGSGQLLAGSWWSLPWFLAAGLLAVFRVTTGPMIAAPPIAVLQLAATGIFGLCSAEHAKRLVERRSPRSSSAVAQTRVVRGPLRGRVVEIRIEIDVRTSIERLWAQISDLPRFLAIDPFHEQVVLMRPRPAAGVDLALGHNAFGWRFLRFGRILSWREGQGYAFSDLSRRGPGRAFPHVFFVNIERIADRSGPYSRLTIGVRGKWTSRWIPARLGLCWLSLVCAEHARLLRQEM